MNGKNSKKIKQRIRREYGFAMDKWAEANSRLIKPKPKFFPMWLWIKLLGIFIYIRK